MDIDLRGRATPLVSVIVPARNEAGAIDECLSSILTQTMQSLEVIVIDGGSTDETVAKVLSWTESDRRVRLIHNPDRIIPKSLNLASHAARGKHIVRIDAHASVPEDYVERLTTHLETGHWGGVGGLKVGAGQTETGEIISAAMASPFGVGNSPYHYGTGLREIEHIPFGAYPKELVIQLGGWDETFLVHQDFEFDYRVRQSGHRILCDSDIVIDWQCRQTIADLAAQYFRYGKGKAHMIAKNPASVRWRHLIPPSLVLGCIAGLALLVGGQTALGMLPFAAYGVFLLVATLLQCPQQRTPRKLATFMAALAAMQVPWGTGVLFGIVFRRWS